MCRTYCGTCGHFACKCGCNRTRQKECEDCNGTGASNGVWYDDEYADEANRKENPCRTCEGTGEVDDIYLPLED